MTRRPYFHRGDVPCLCVGCMVCALWLVCLLLCYVLGASFAYYCMFAAIAFELVAAVYYTFQLK